MNFWEHNGELWQQEGYVIEDAADLDAVLTWIEANSRARRFELFIEAEEEDYVGIDTPRKSSLIWLLGENPLFDDDSSVEFEFVAD